ncbi:uncharacterized protein APUU_70993A [Aspergillus puulaauensis]|uniref:DUF8035 domain-containing protein n=1 Tax=Aspergillus puulaauensis TaxID=1220207 RepID=A0A7R8AU00_9EURO|nr:uncharacterized protein APUU_70993A [Aspergillus puulaauensis]BCS29423.1 hypothetical protein APUU_70993A [Aspergillus puulaauensis]
MGSTARSRPMSPGSSHLIDPMRASTGTVPLSSSYDPYDSSAGHPMYAGYRSDVPYLPSYDPRYNVPPRLEAHAVSQQAYRDHGKPSKLRTEYTIRPRQRSSTASAADPRGMLEVPSTSPISRHSPVIFSDYGRTPSPLTDQDGYLMPSSSKGHRRHRYSSSFDYASDTGRHPTSRTPYGAYPVYEHGSRRRYPQNGGLRKGEDIDNYDAYSYTNPREQFEKEAAAKLQYHRNARKERPLSLTGIDDTHLTARKEPRALGPPPSHRGFSKLTRDELRRSTFGPGNGELDLPGARHSTSSRAVALHQDHGEGYSSHKDDYNDTRPAPREHKRPDRDTHGRDHDSHGPTKSSNKLSAPSVSSSGLGTAVLASGYSDDVDYNLASRSDGHRSRDRPHREHTRPRRHSRRRRESDSDAYTSDDDLEKYRREPSMRPRIDDSDSSKENDHPHRRRHRSRSRRHDRLHSDTKLEQKLELAQTKESDAPPKGILKPPRDKFPEEPNPVREGVAPLKDAHKKGIPPGARWTKIDRRLVNPAALEAGQERFEERSDYVIVLRVLSKEEIQTYAVKTQEIRDAKYREYTRERRRQREEDRRRGRPVDDFSSDDEDDSDNDSPLAIEGPGESKSAPKNSAPKPEGARPA